MTAPHNPEHASTTTASARTSSGATPKPTISMASSAHATANRRGSANSATSTATSPEEQRRQDKRVWCIRAATVTTLVAATVTVASFVGWYVHKDEVSNFEMQYKDSVSKLSVQFQNRLDSKYEVAKTFSAMITSRYGNVAQEVMGLGPIWPNVTVPNFQEQSAGSLAMAEGRALSYNPIITQGKNRKEWEKHAAESAWILGSESLITPEPNTTWPDNRTVAFGIYSRNSEKEVVYDPGYVEDSLYPDVMVPVWQIAPIVTNEKAVMFNLHSEPNRRSALDHMMKMKVAAITPILQLVQDKETRPSSILFYPVFDVFQEDGDGVDAENRRESEVDTESEQDTKIVARGSDEGVRRLRLAKQNTGDTGEHMTEKQNTADTGGEHIRDVEGVQRKLISGRTDGGTENQNVVGSVSIVFSWDTLLNNILPDYIKGMVCVLQTSTGQKRSYSISGDTVTFLGEEDLHDPDYDEYGRHFNAQLLYEEQSKEFVLFSLSFYPSAEFKSQYVTNRAAIYAAGAVLIFLFTAGMFILYDYLVEDRQKKTARLARQTGNIVDSMFPAAFRERLYKIHGDGDPAARRRSTMDGDPTMGRRNSYASCESDTDTGRASFADNGLCAQEDSKSTATNSSLTGGNSLPIPSMGIRKASTLGAGGKKKALKKIDKFMRGIRTEEKNAQSNHMLAHSGSALVDEEPIAELFHDTSIMFSDIVGFTKWSSERTPNEVFQLLEQIFWEFDDLAAKHNVFKLGTIGDCYIAVTGIPDPVQDHATLLTQFTFDARDKVREVCAKLDAEGLDTAKLDMRFGIHSGPTTAGILRGTKSRFELFGDTINTASRMESTGQAGKIQVSEETAKLIRRDCKSGWLSKRETLITAKGKGELQTYWVEPTGRRVSFSENLMNTNIQLTSLLSLDETGDECEDLFDYDLGGNSASAEVKVLDANRDIESGRVATASEEIEKLLEPDHCNQTKSTVPCDDETPSDEDSVFDANFLAYLNSDSTLDNNNCEEPRSGTPGSDRFYQHEYGSSAGGSVGGQLSQWEEEKVEEEHDQLSSKTRVNGDVELTTALSLDQTGDKYSAKGVSSDEIKEKSEL